MERLLIGIDDTDFGESIGTGALARELRLHLSRALQIEAGGITRHQLLVHPDIPYTSHNSAACLELLGDADPGEVAGAASRFLSFLFHDGADPGLCVAYPKQLDAACRTFGARAQREVVTKAEAIGLAAEAGVTLRELGGTGLGIIGALSACALRAGGADGRFISLAGIREVPDRCTVAEILDGTAIDVVADETGALPREATVETNGWVRPDLRDQRVVLRVAAENGGYRVVGKKKSEQTFEK